MPYLLTRIMVCKYFLPVYPQNLIDEQNKIEYNTHYNFTYLIFHRNLDHLHIIFVDIH